MVGDHWFVYPVENGVELVIDCTEQDETTYERALAAFVEHFTDYNLAAEWSTEGGEVLHFVPAILDEHEPLIEAPAPAAQVVPGPRERTEAESRAAHPAGKGRRIPRQPDAI